MKRTLTGVEAFSKILSTPLPAKTESYTPISHSSVINRMRNEITKAGFVILGEDYRCTNDGQVALGSLRLNYKADPDIELSANFTNSYNKQLAFRFGLGGVVKVCSNGMVISNDKFGRYKRVHKGSADILAEGKISEFLAGADEYWNTLIDHKEELKDMHLSDPVKHDIVGQLFFGSEILNTMQLNIIKSEIKKPSFDYKVDNDSAWALYNHITLALKEGHPSSWLEDQAQVHSIFVTELGIATKEEEEEDIYNEDSIS